MRVFIDTNVLIDTLIPGRTSAEASACIFKLIRTTSMEGWMTTQSIIDAAYITAKSPGYDDKRFRQVIGDLLSYVNVGGIGYFDLEYAINATEIDDIEDCAQAFFADYNNCDIIISGDKDFRIPNKMEPTPVMTPKAFLDRLRAVHPL